MKIMEIPPLIKGQKCVLLTAFRSSGAHIALRWEDNNSEDQSINLYFKQLHTLDFAHKAMEMSQFYNSQ